MLQTNLIVLLLQRVPGMHIIPVFYDRGLWTLNPVWLCHPLDCQCCRAWNYMLFLSFVTEVYGLCILYGSAIPWNAMLQNMKMYIIPVFCDGGL